MHNHMQNMLFAMAPCSSPRYCSTGCTRDGTLTLVREAGLARRLAEAVSELSYGRLSYAWDVSVTDTLELPQVRVARTRVL